MILDLGPLLVEVEQFVIILICCHSLAGGYNLPFIGLCLLLSLFSLRISFSLLGLLILVGYFARLGFSEVFGIVLQSHLWLDCLGHCETKRFSNCIIKLVLVTILLGVNVDEISWNSTGLSQVIQERGIVMP